MPQRIPDNFEVRKPRLLDNKEGPWSSTAEAIAYITKDIRAQGQVVKVLSAGSIVEYWWKDGIDDSDLVAKSSGGSTSVVWGGITGTLSNQTDLQSALDAIHGLPSGGDAGQLLAKNSATDYDVTWIDNYANWTSQLKHEVKLGEVISKGQAVYVSSADGTNMIVTKASNATEATSSKTLGLLESGGSTNAKVKVITEGLLSGLDTSSANAAGDPVWLGTSGNLIYGLTNKPIAPAHLVFIGIVTRKNNNNGEIFVKVQNGFELKEIHDVLLSSPATNDFLYYASDGLWKNKQLSKSDVGLGNVPNTDATNPANITQSASYRFVTDTEKSTWNALPRVVYTDYTAETTTSTSTTNPLTTFSLTIADADWPLGGLLRLSGLMERTAGTGSVLMGVVVNGSTARYVSSNGQNTQWEWAIIKEAANTLRIGMGPSNTTSGSYTAHNQSTVTATASGGNYVFTFYMFVNTAGATGSMRWMKGLMIP